MKKILSIALAATMILTMGLSVFADNIKQLGNFVITEDLFDPETEETLEEESQPNIDPSDNYDNTSSNENVVKNNPSTGAGDFDIFVLSAVGIIAAGVSIVIKK